MPEGDTIHKLAARLREHIEGRCLDGLWLRERGWLEVFGGSRVDEVAAIGKHLLVVIRSERTRPTRWILHVHLGMRGRWSVVSPDDAAARSRHPARVRLAVAGREWVATRTSVAELLRPGELEAHPTLSRLGPDLLDGPLDLDRIVQRARAYDPRTVSDLLLDQRIACGLGNVYRNELLFLAGLPPTAPTVDVSDEAIRRLYARGGELLRANLGGWRRTTTRRVTPEEPLRRGEPRSFVYGRKELPCLRCQRSIRASRVGDMARATYWCPSCQAHRPLPLVRAEGKWLEQ